MKRLIIPFLSALKIKKTEVVLRYIWGHSVVLPSKDMRYYPYLYRKNFLYIAEFYLEERIETFIFLRKSDYLKFKKKMDSHSVPTDFFSNIKQVIKESQQLYKKLIVEEYLRDSSVSRVNTTITPLIRNYKRANKNQNEFLSSVEGEWLKKHSDDFPLDAEKVAFLRDWYTKKQLNKQKVFFDFVESNPLTEDQRLACIRDNDRNMVLAAAGTGKTSVVVAKALNLVVNHDVNPDDILILAYNKKAAIELQERLVLRATLFGIEEEGKLPKISTFHALGLNIVRAAKVPSHLSKFAEDPVELDKWIDEWLTHFLQNEENIQDFLSIIYRESDPFSFTSRAEFERYHRDNEHRTLNGILVKGYQELLIGNWLFSNGIDFEYESNYVRAHKIEHWHSYSPDFKIISKDGREIYLEHFGIDRQGNTRPDIDKDNYNTSIESKRKLHQEVGTILIETYHYDWLEGSLLTRLADLLKQHDIEAGPVDNEVLMEALHKYNFLKVSRDRLSLALKAIRVSLLSDDEVFQLLFDAKVSGVKAYHRILTALHRSYIEELRSSGSIDFDDMISLATNVIEDGYLKGSSWEHILIDEFQDISESRMGLIKALIKKGSNPKLTVVGDDWQSIYRFAGGKLELTTRFNNLVGSFSQTVLRKTFRYNNSIANTAGHFIMQNPEQYRKEIETHVKVSTPMIFLLDDRPTSERIVSLDRQINKKEHLEEKVAQVVLKINESDPNATIAILSRYNFYLNNLRSFFQKNRLGLNNINYWTLHGSKGLEADHCIIVGLTQGKLGFPSENKDHEVIDALLPSLDRYKYSEERRLFYVGLTRAKKRVYLVADSRARSVFVDELIGPQYDIAIHSNSFSTIHQKIFKCPKCVDGSFVEYNGKYGHFYSCTTGSGCGLTAKTCPNCEAPFVIKGDIRVCQNDNCLTCEKLCPKCGRPLRKREGKFGVFYGCSGYGIPDDPCSYTSNI